MKASNSNADSMSRIDSIIRLAESDVDYKILRALVCTLTPQQRQTLHDKSSSLPVFARILSSLQWEEENTANLSVRSEPLPKYRNVKVLIRDFLNPDSGRRHSSRLELQKRLMFLSAHEQKQTILAFMQTGKKTDRIFVSHFLDEHYDPQYNEQIVALWTQYHDFTTAKLIVHHFPDDFIAQHHETLSKDYRYLPVRLRLPANSTVDRSQMDEYEWLFLCAKQGLTVTQQEAYTVLTYSVYSNLQVYVQGNVSFSSNFSLNKMRHIESVIWALGHLGFYDIIMQFNEINQKTKPIFASVSSDESCKQAVKQALEVLHNDLPPSTLDLGTKHANNSLTLSLQLSAR